MDIFIIVILGIILVVFLIPWYVQQLGRFFAKGFTEFATEWLDLECDKLTGTKGERNG